MILRPSLNRLILERASLLSWHASPIAPGTWDDLTTQRAGHIIVWDGASANTIYGDPRVNHAFRAWHDATHLAGNWDFSIQGERATCEAQKALCSNPEDKAVIHAEIVGQLEHVERFGTFPDNQAGFISAYLRNGRVIERY